jgi:hypothetical protein
MLRQLMISLLMVGMISSIARGWLLSEVDSRRSVEESTATAMAALEEFRKVTLTAYALDRERDCQLRMMAIRDEAIAEANLPNKKLIDVTEVLYGRTSAVYPNLLERLRKTTPGESDVERLARYLVKHMNHRAQTGDYGNMNQQRAKELEEELESDGFSLKCQKLESKDNQTK